MSKKNTKVLGVIHARGGSKRIPLKNIKLLNGKPLVAYIITAALKSKMIDRLIVSTDHPEIIRIAKEYGAEVPFIRPKDISEDVPSELVTQHALKFIEAEEGHEIGVIVTFQPTTPFCQPEHIDACVNKLIERNMDSVFSVKEIRERPEWMFLLNEKDEAETFMGHLIQGETGVTQSLQKLYIPNGGIYATKREVLMEQNLIIGRKTGIVVMSPEHSVDIDEPIDFVFAEFLAKERGF